MTKCIAILVGVADYQNEKRLPQCRADLGLVSSIISASNKYEAVLSLDSPSSADAKSKIASFIREHEGQQIDEIFFYFSGHGARIADDFIYLFADFSNKRTRQTSVSNGELDAMFRSLNPGTMVKLIDACFAGHEYVKSDVETNSILEKSGKDSFSKVYFFFSSSRDEESVALRDLSVFTKSFASAVREHHPRDVRYRDIISYIADDEAVTAFQSPFFVTQANNTEVFCAVSDEVRQAIDAIVETSKTEDGHDQVATEQGDPPTFEQMLIQAVRSKSAGHCDEISGMNGVQKFISSMESSRLSDPLKTLFEVSINPIGDYDDIPGTDAVGTWLSKSTEPYFAEVRTTEKPYIAKERVDATEDFPFARTWEAMGRKKYETREVTRYRTVTSGFSHTIKVPHRGLSIQFKPLEHALPSFLLFVTYVFSKARLTAFFRLERERSLSWSSRKIVGDGTWSIYHASLSDHNEIESLARQAIVDVEETIVARIASEFSVNRVE